MTIKKCTCGHNISSKRAKIIGVTRMTGKRIMWVNCPACESTVTLFGRLKKIAAVVAAIVVASCAPKSADRYVVCQPVQVSCSSGECAPAMKDKNSGQFVNANQCDEVQ